VQVVIKNYIQEIEKSEPKRFAYIPKASKNERNFGLDNQDIKVDCDRNPECYSADVPFNRSANPKKNNHPTVKPIALMQYLIKLVTPKNGIVLDMFAGSGSTLVAAKQLGFNYIGIEKEAEYVKIAEARLLAIPNQQRLE
jgi:site-specific DNA-methyltransferase (adenine-specific)